CHLCPSNRRLQTRRGIAEFRSPSSPPPTPNSHRRINVSGQLVQPIPTGYRTSEGVQAGLYIARQFPLESIGREKDNLTTKYSRAPIEPISFLLDCVRLWLERERYISS